jgi:hypothetical protein
MFQLRHVNGGQNTQVTFVVRRIFCDQDRAIVHTRDFIEASLALEETLAWLQHACLIDQSDHIA